MAASKTARYSVQEMADLSGVSVRTLHYYDEIGLLPPTRRQNKYREYGALQVDRLQQILLYREMGLELSAIKAILDDPDFDDVYALKGHLQALKQQRTRLEGLIAGVEKTLAAKEGKTKMSDSEKFENLKKKLIEENEEMYGDEIREKYGDDTVDASNAKMMGMTEEQYAEVQELSEKVNTTLAQAMEEGDPAGETAQLACDLHRQWLTYMWKDGTYSKEAHMGLGEMYVADDRFKAYYEKIAPGAAEFLRDALKVYCA